MFRPLVSRSWWGAHIPHPTPPPARTLPPVHFIWMTALCCPWVKLMTKYAKGAQTPSLSPSSSPPHSAPTFAAASLQIAVVSGGARSSGDSIHNHYKEDAYI